MIIQILFQQGLDSRILEAGNDLSSQQCFQVEGLDNIPIFPSPDSRALLAGAELPLSSPMDVGAKQIWEIPELRTKGEYFGKTSFFKLNSLSNNIPALKPPWPL